MKKDQTITQSRHHLIKKLAFAATFLLVGAFTSSCQSDDKAQKKGQAPIAGQVVQDFKTYPVKSFALTNGKLIKTYVADSSQKQTQGLSGVKPSQLRDNEGMIFWYKEKGPRRFWMPNTFTDLDIFFLDENFKVIHIERNVPAHPGMEEPPVIARTPTVVAFHVLELKAASPLAKEIQTGDQLQLIE